LAVVGRKVWSEEFAGQLFFCPEVEDFRSKFARGIEDFSTKYGEGQGGRAARRFWGWVAPLDQKAQSSNGARTI